MREKIELWLARKMEFVVANAPALLSASVLFSVLFQVLAVFSAVIEVWIVAAIFEILCLGFLTLLVGMAILVSRAIDRETRRRLVERTAANKISPAEFRNYNSLIEGELSRSRS